jgi:hypothetical protein
MFYAFFRQLQLGLLLTLICLPSHAAPQYSADSTAHNDRGAYYYNVRRDLRRCISPLCGGYWISRVNRESTPCADGSRQAECYVAEIDWGSIGLDGSEGTTLIRGIQRLRNFPNFGRLGVLLPKAAWRPATDSPAEGTWYGLQDNGLRCVTFPCYHIKERVLNGNAVQTISNVDLGEVSASPADEEAGYNALSRGELIAVGKNEVIPDEGPAGDGLTLVASQFFLRVKPQVHTELYCDTVDDCTLTTYHRFVSSPEECYCPLCPVTLNAKTARKHEKSWQQHCAHFGFNVSRHTTALTCPQVRCMAPPPMGCVNHSCVFLDQEPARH